MRIFVVFALLVSSLTFADDWKDLSMRGYAVVATTRVAGQFNGCEFDRVIQFTNGLRFKCQTYWFAFYFSPEVSILKNVNDGSIKVIIEDHEYEGIVFKPK